MLAALSGICLTGETLPIPVNFDEGMCTFIHAISETSSVNSNSRSYATIRQDRVGRIVNNIMIRENSSAEINEGKVNYLVFAKTPNEMMGIVQGTVTNGESIPKPAGTFLNYYSFVSISKIESTWNQLGLKYFSCKISSENTVEIYSIREDVISFIPGIAHYVTIGVP